MTLGARRLFGVALLGFAWAAFAAWEITTPRLAVRFEAPLWPMWQARLASAGMAALGVAAVFVMMTRLVDRRAATYAAVVLSTTPAWFVHGRTSTGAMSPMAGEALVLAGLSLAWLDGRLPRWARAGAMGVAAMGAAMGIATRGAAGMIAPTACAVGMVGWAQAKARAHARAEAGAKTNVIAGMVLCGLGIVLFAMTATGRWVGGPLGEAGSATFDAPVAAAAYGWLPWTPLLPLALVRREGTALFGLTMALGLGLHALAARHAGGASMMGAAPMACAVAVAARSLDDAKRTNIVVVLAMAVVGWLVAHDVGLSPERIVTALGTAPFALPPGSAADAARDVRSATLLSVALAAVVLVTPRTWLPTSRGVAVVAAGAVAGLVLRAHAYPLLLSRLSPGRAFDVYERQSRPGEPLATLDVDTRALPNTTVPLTNVTAATSWLAEPGPRYLALAAQDLVGVNAAWRAIRGENLSILTGHDETVLLATNTRGLASENPLDAVVMSAPPRDLMPLAARFGDDLAVIGWSHTGSHVKIALRVLRPIHAYCTFVHVEHAPTRFSVEHREHPYPMTAWRPGDVVVDDFELRVPPAFTGSVTALFGVGVLPCHDDRRLAVTSGPVDGHDRVPLGHVVLR